MYIWYYWHNTCTGVFWKACSYLPFHSTQKPAGRESPQHTVQGSGVCLGAAELWKPNWHNRSLIWWPSGYQKKFKISKLYIAISDAISKRKDAPSAVNKIVFDKLMTLTLTFWKIITDLCKWGALKERNISFYLYGSPCCRKSFCSLALALAFNSLTTTLVPGSV